MPSVEDCLGQPTGDLMRASGASNPTIFDTAARLGIEPLRTGGGHARWSPEQAERIINYLAEKVRPSEGHMKSETPGRDPASPKERNEVANSTLAHLQTATAVAILEAAG
jgi:hypothetical protein